jgi:hypothetical protein
VLELDLIGRSVTLAESDVRWIYAQAKTASGRSLGARDLATRLQDLEPDQERRRLILTRPEANALARLLDAAGETPPGCDELRANLDELHAISHSASDPRLEGDAVR